ncbi:Scr1 family TA system antitoxin-like transcriptional regulator [Nocardiopsis sp. HUAS JQ3]|nr:Scr1 family TA system antitoxin-like transcriptional regulator [Nocardiopsis sp. HUAS JQ3]
MNEGFFVILEFPEPADPTVVYLEKDSNGVYLEEPEEIARYRNLVNRLRLATLRPSDTIDHLRQMIA